MHITNNLREEILQYKSDLTKLRAAKYSISNIIGGAPAMLAVKETLYRISQTSSIPSYSCDAERLGEGWILA